MSDWPFAPPLSPMKAVVREKIPVGDWAYEPKWDGFRMIAWSRPDVRLDSRTGRPLLRYLPELTPALERASRGHGGRRRDRGGDRRPGQLRRSGNRIHPAASRVAMLAEQTPAALVVSTCSPPTARTPARSPSRERRGGSRARGWSGRAVERQPAHHRPRGGASLVRRIRGGRLRRAGAKRLDQRYVEEKREMVKMKHRRTVDVVIGGYREHKDGDSVGSLLLGMYAPNGQLHFVGHTSGFYEK